jgi:hypothetical protein
VSIRIARRLLVAGAGAMLLVMAATTDVAAMTSRVSPGGIDGGPASSGSGETARIPYPAAPGEQA